MANNGCFGRFLAWFVCGALVGAVCAVTTSVAVSADPTEIPLNDTGIAEFFDDWQKLPSEPITHPRQDASYGRDTLARAGKLKKKGGGNAGFDFTKIDNNGNVVSHLNAVLGPSPTDWACTLDNVTGLMWEVKTTSGLRSKDYTYSWYNNTTSNGGNAGESSGGICYTSGHCDTEKFVQDVNAAGLCGAKDWRMPTIKELLTIANYGRANPAVDPEYFPNIPDKNNIWSGTTQGSPGNGGLVAYNIGLGNIGWISAADKNKSPYSNIPLDALGVLLVRGGKQDYSCTNPDSEYKDNGDGTVTHLPTQLTWKRCAEGQKWKDGTCEGMFGYSEWGDALDFAAKSEFAGYTDWRLPDVKELYGSMMECFDKSNASVNARYFPNMPFWPFWTSSNYAPDFSKAWTVQPIGATTDRDSKVTKGSAIRFVRDGSTAIPATTCTYTLNSSSMAVASTANNEILGVTTSLKTCAWIATSNANWITLTSGASGTGGGTVAYSVTANSGTAARTGTITVSGKTAAGNAVTRDFIVTQKAQGSGPGDESKCTYTLKDKIGVATTSVSVGAAASANNLVYVATSPLTCSWAATSNVSWITIDSAYSKNNGPANTFYSVEANLNATSRTGTLTIAGQTFTVTQAGTNGSDVDPAVESPTPTPTPTPSPTPTPTPTPTPISTQPPNRGLTPTPTPTPGRPPGAIKTSPHQIKATGGLDRFYPGSGLVD